MIPIPHYLTVSAILFTIGAIARVLGVSIDYLAGLYEDKDSEQLATAVA